MANRERLIELGWKQGALLDPNEERFQENAHYKIPDHAHLLIISQTCDLIQGSFEIEPYFEALCLHPLGQQPNGGYLGGKNSRRIEFSLEIDGGGDSHWFAVPHNRHLVTRELLLDRQADSYINDAQTLKMLLAWLSRRYTRTAFPEAFVSRIDARKDSISKKFSRLNHHISNVFVRISPFLEQDADKEYSMEIILVMDAEKFDDTERHKSCVEIKNQLENQLRKCKGINVDEIIIESTAMVTLEDLKGFSEWDYSYLSFREPDEAAMPVEL